MAEQTGTTRRERRIRLLTELRDNFQTSINSRRCALKEFWFTEEELTVLRDACIEERQRLLGH